MFLKVPNDAAKKIKKANSKLMSIMRKIDTFKKYSIEEKLCEVESLLVEARQIIEKANERA